MQPVLILCLLVGTSFAEKDYDSLSILLEDENGQNQMKDVLGTLFSFGGNKDPHQMAQDMDEAFYNIAAETDRPLQERARAISEEFVKPHKSVGYLLGIGIAASFDAHSKEFKDRFGGNWKPALKEFIRRTKNSQANSEYEKEQDKGRITADLARKYRRTPLREVTTTNDRPFYRTPARKAPSYSDTHRNSFVDAPHAMRLRADNFS